MNDWVVAISSALALALLWKANKPKFLWLVKPVLACIAGSSFAETGFGNTVAGWIGGIAGWVGSWFGIGGSIIAAIVVLGLVIILFREIVVGRNSNSVELVALLVLPMLFLVSAGPIAQSGSQIAAAWANMGQASIGRLVGV